jgi:arylsulfatase A-like enzyme
MNRRDFLKLAGALPFGYAASRLMQPFAGFHRQDQPDNILILVFDAFSAHNISLYGYDRETTPNIARLAQRAIRYHNHYAGGNFTTPGTASLLTGVLPWTHRAINLKGNVLDRFMTQNVFGAFPVHYRIAYSHNPLANRILMQFAGSIDQLIPRESLYLESYDTLVSTLFKNDDDISSISWIRAMKVNEEGVAYSLFLSHLYETLQDKQIENLKSRFPRGIPSISQVNPYLLETAVNSVAERLQIVPRPFLGYYHFMPPHQPYRTSAGFYNSFKNDGFKAVEKPVDILAKQKRIASQPSLDRLRTEYDEFILYCDDEFDRLFNDLESAGILEDTWLILTSDHGELFERGIFGHDTKVLYQPVVRIPLMIFEPGRTEGMDIHTPTSAVDILPTLAHLTGQPSPAWIEGTILPPFAAADSNRNLYAVQAIESNANAPLDQVSISMVRDNFKLHYYRGYEETAVEDIVKLFDLKSDPEEMDDLARTKSGTASELLNELKASLAEADKPFVY